MESSEFILLKGKDICRSTTAVCVCVCVYVINFLKKEHIKKQQKGTRGIYKIDHHRGSKMDNEDKGGGETFQYKCFQPLPFLKK